MTPENSLKIGAVFIILLASFVGIIVPVYLVRVSNDRVKYAFDVFRCVSIGLILGVAMMHMLPEADGIFGEALAASEHHDDHPANETAVEEEEEGHGHGAYPYAFMFTCFGVVLMLLLEQIAAHLAEGPAKESVKPQDAPESSVNESHGHAHGPGDLHSHHDASLKHGDDKLKAYVIEVSISLHSILIGIGLGVLQDYNSIEILLIALTFHQLFEGFALGGAVAKANQSKIFLASLIGFFSLSCPLGVAIGAGIANSFDPSNPAGAWTQGVLYGFATGTLLYIGLYDLMAESFQKPNEGAKKFNLVFAVLFGVGLMALLAVWA